MILTSWQLIFKNRNTSYYIVDYIFTLGDSGGMKAVQKGGCLTIANGSHYVCGVYYVLIINKYG